MFKIPNNTLAKICKFLAGTKHKLYDGTYVLARWIEMSNNSSPTVARSSAFQSPFGWDTSRWEKVNSHLWNSSRFFFLFYLCFLYLRILFLASKYAALIASYVIHVLSLENGFLWNERENMWVIDSFVLFFISIIFAFL